MCIVLICLFVAHGVCVCVCVWTSDKFPESDTNELDEMENDENEIYARIVNH